MARLSIALIITIINVLCVLAEEKLYSDEFDNTSMILYSDNFILMNIDNIDIQTVFNDKDLIEGYYNCFMETGPCKTQRAHTAEIFYRYFCIIIKLFFLVKNFLVKTKFFNVEIFI